VARIAAAGRVATTRNNSILRNGDFATYPAVLTALTNTADRWIDGTSGGTTAKMAFRWAAPSAGSGAGANGSMGFDSTVYRTAAASMKLSTLNASGAVTACSARTIAPTAATAYQLFRLQPNTTYTLTGYIRTNNVAANGAFIDVREFTTAFATVATNSTNKLSGTDTSWREVTVTFTTGATTAFGCIFLRNNVAGNTSDAWFDDITLVPALLGRVAHA
jgi:hypothetical protein